MNWCCNSLSILTFTTTAETMTLIIDVKFSSLCNLYLEFICVSCWKGPRFANFQWWRRCSLCILHFPWLINDNFIYTVWYYTIKSFLGQPCTNIHRLKKRLELSSKKSKMFTEFKEYVLWFMHGDEIQFIIQMSARSCKIWMMQLSFNVFRKKKYF